MPEEITADERAACLRVLQRISEDPSVIADDERMKALIAKIHRAGKKGERRAGSVQRQEADRAVRGSTAMAQRDLQRRPSADAPAPASAPTAGTLHRPRACYVCKTAYAEVHFFYHQLCPACAVLNYARREQRADLRGQTAILTGGRIKIGYQLVLRMLRDGARVLLTTRFPADARRRLSAEPDFAAWRDRVQLYPLDLRNLPAVEQFAQHLVETEPHAEILINNAAQTIKRPRAFYEHLLAEEAETPVLLEALPRYAALEAGAAALPAGDGSPLSAYFPEGALDADGQQEDQRPRNSWSLRLHEVTTLETLEVHLVNAVAPAILCRALKPLLCRSPFPRRFVVNVSAMEGQFGRETKTPRHPHTNMAKAALNMLTRTAGADYARDGIYMNSVDTGWITDENPYERRERIREQGFYTPLDLIDGAARVYDPIVRGLSEPGEPLFGQFLKDYAPYPW